MASQSTKFSYARLNQDESYQKSAFIRILLLLVAIFFLFFCAMGFASSQYPTVTLNDKISTFHEPPKDHLQALKYLLNCPSTDAGFRIYQKGKFWVLENFLNPLFWRNVGRRPVECYETVTYTTHGDFRFLDNVVPLLERWKAPLSVALYGPGKEFGVAIDALLELYHCHPQSYLVEEFASFHLYFDFDQMPDKEISFYRRKFLNRQYDCETTSNSSQDDKLPSKRSPNHLYPVNVGRNIARAAAQTHFVLASDIELYPNPGFVDSFLKMVAHPAYRYTLEEPNVYVLPVFEIQEHLPIPEDKLGLLQMLQRGEAIKFHEKICASCHTVPSYREWLELAKEDRTMDILVTAQRVGDFGWWEPIYVGSKREPPYDERLSWEGKFDKMTQGYIMCLLGYNFHVLDNGFLVHKPGIKSQADAARPAMEAKQRAFVEETIRNELNVLYGINDRCRL
ncbi:beta-1,4-glucuronyltransferase 1-like isoform X2 [Uranotaenia lowii]|uniref:beta-1,4-glucuronyltransferase 1-like isoform X2 n=1 Tax=Uranotaenia lowii TaxID=190385 RepID=UPI0024789D88|nr:beta-1,4-glucuronyltransferase 1-like isoform X2 [Uranotaenia lowii]